MLHEHKGDWNPLTAREAPRLLAWRASYPFAPDAPRAGRAGVGRAGVGGRDPDTQQKWPDLLRHLDANHQTLSGINARVLQAGRIAADEGVEITM